MECASVPAPVIVNRLAYTCCPSLSAPTMALATGTKVCAVVSPTSRHSTEDRAGHPLHRQQCATTAPLLEARRAGETFGDHFVSYQQLCAGLHRMVLTFDPSAFRGDGLSLLMTRTLRCDEF